MAGSNGYRPIDDYGLIGDTHTAALVSSEGSIDWYCLPNFDGASVFAKILDRERGGYFSIQPREPFESRQSYIEGTNVLTTVFRTDTGAVRLTDFMPVPSLETSKQQLFPLREIVRCIEGLDGEVEMTLEYKPRPDFASRLYPVEQRSPFVLIVQGMEWSLNLISEVPLERHGQDVYARFHVREAQRLSLGLAYDQETPAIFPSQGKRAFDLLGETITFWRGWLSKCNYSGPYAEHVRRSALALKLLSSSLSGAVIGAPTTSLPERIGGTRNWDYRLCWLRDASLTLGALQDIGFVNEAQYFLQWMLHTTRITHPKLKVVYTIFGETAPKEKELMHLEGYRSSRPVRVGNRAVDQEQLDIYGQVLGGLIHAHPHIQDFSSDTWSLVSGAADFVALHWRDPDHGIWEMQFKGQFTHSKALCWVALDRAQELYERFKPGDAKIGGWAKEKDEISRVVAGLGYNREVGAFTQHLGGSDLDAAVLTFPILGFVDPQDPRMLSTVKAIKERLTVNGLVYRYLSEDGLPGTEGTFGACTFWLAHCLALQGDVDGGRQIIESELKCMNPLGLLPEQFDPHTREALGNYPQGLTHIGFINAALAISKAEEANSERKRPQESRHRAHGQ
jgi:GH15 family glucan-1,4-alpha-glucosidase